MKELNNFRNFLNEDLDEGMMDKLKKFGKKVKDVADKMDGGPDGGGIFGGLPGGKPTPQNDKMKKEQEGELHEGTWALGSVAEMVKVMGMLSQIRKMGAAKGGIELENLDNILYNVFGDDSFHDAIDAAKDTDDDDRFNNFMIDAEARAKSLYKDELRDAKEQGETGFEFKPRFGLEENDKVLDEVLNEAYRNPEIPVDKVLQVLQDFYVRDLTRLKQELERSSGEPTAQPGFKAKLEDLMTKLSGFGSKSLEDVEAKVKLKEEKEEVNENMQMFREIDDMLSRTAIHMNASDFVDELVQEFEAISGGPKKLHQALKNIVLNNNIPEADFEKDSAAIKKRNEIRSAYNEEKGDE